MSNKKVEIYVLKDSLNLFSRQWIELFRLWNTYISVLRGNIVSSVKGFNAAGGLKKKIAVKQSGTPVCKLKRNKKNCSQ